MSTSEDRWFEVWFTDGSDTAPTYLLVVVSDEQQKGIVVVLDPIKKNEKVYEGTYEDTKLWLLEDEYELVAGRMFPDDGW